VEPKKKRLQLILSISLVSIILITSQSLVAFAGNGGWEDKDNDGYSTFQGDCDDNDPNVYPVDGRCLTTIEIDSDVEDDVEVGSDEQVIISNGATVEGNIKIEGGTLILSEGVIVKGNVEIEKGGALEISGSTVEGNVKGKDGSTTIIDTTIILGNIESDKEESVIIMDSTIDGNILVKEANSVTVTGNTVDGNLEIDNTSGSCIDTGNNVNGNFDGCP